MRNLLDTPINRYRQRNIEISIWGVDPTLDPGKAGVFMVPSPTSMLNLRVIAASGEGWDHLSVSTSRRCPTWEEMDWLKRRVFFDDEVVMQLHVGSSDHINTHPYCLHMWRPHDQLIPLPPKAMV